MKHLLGNTARLMAGLGMAIVVAWQPMSASAQSMAGKTITLVHNASPGGATALGAQVTADAWTKQIEGNPEMIVQSVAGGALSKGIHHVMNAKPNGLTLGWLAWQGSTRILDPEELRIDFDKFGVIGGVGGATFFFHLRTAAGDGIKSAEDLMKAENLTIAGYSAKSSAAMQLAASLDMLGVSWKFASGFRGDGPLYAALARGEVDGYPATAVYYNQQLKDGPIADGESLAMYHFNTPIGPDSMLADPAYAGAVPTFPEFYEAQTGKKPSGPEWDIINFHGRVSNPVNWLVVAPPGTSHETLTMLRLAFAQAVSTPEYQEAAARVFGGKPNIVLADEMLGIVKDVKNTPDEMKAALRAYIDKMQQ